MEIERTRELRKTRSKRRNGRREEKRDNERTRPERSVQEPIGVAPQNALLVLENSDDGGDNNLSMLMCPSLRRQLQTHKNVLRLLHEHKLSATQINGQRILSIQSVRWTGPTPGIECEIFVGHIPKTIYEDTLYPLFKLVGEVFQIRLMVDMTELTRGYCFIMYTKPEDAARAITQLDQYEISPGNKIRVLASINKCKLYVGPLPWCIPSEEVVRVIYASAWDIEYVSIYRFTNGTPAYAIVSFRSHRNAALARRKLRPERLFKSNEVQVDWAYINWKPFNVYEDRGTVDEKGDVQITRKYLQSKNTASTSAQCNYNRSRKRITPICPPNSNAQLNTGKALHNGGTRCSAVLTMSARLEKSSLYDNPRNEEPATKDDEIGYREDYHRDRTQQKPNADAAADVSYPNFDMWNVNLVPQLSSNSARTHINPDGGRSPNDRSSKSARESAISPKHSSSKVGVLDKYRYQKDTTEVLGRCCTYYNRSPSEAADQNGSVAAEIVRYGALPGRGTLMTPRCVLFRQRSYFYPEGNLGYAKDRDRIVAGGDGGCWYNGPMDGGNETLVGVQEPFGSAVNGFHRWGFQQVAIPGKAQADIATAGGYAPSYVQNYSPNFVLNFAPIYAPSVVAEHASENAPYRPISIDKKRRPRAILKRSPDHAQ